MQNIQVYHPRKIVAGTVHLPASKSESNRAQILKALSGNESVVHNLSTARDTQTMMRLLQSKDDTWDVLDAGTTMRFLTAYAILQEKPKIMTGTARMCERPIGLLVDALRSLGAQIDYLGNHGYPPHKVYPLKTQTNDTIQIRGDVSSQFISALCMIAPMLPKGLNIELLGEIGSRPYLEMTLEMMKSFGAQYQFEGNTIRIPAQAYQTTTFFAESDWSGASYWYSIAALADEASIELTGLKSKSLQGDAAVVQIMEKLGIQTTFGENTLFIQKIPHFKLPTSLSVDFSHCPDIAQTLAVVCAGLGVRLELSGVESLKIKETDRLAALQTELGKAGVVLSYEANEKYVVNGTYSASSMSESIIHTYHDHRMAMAFAPLALLGTIQIEDKDCVVKSYPSFWDDLQKLGFELQ